MEFPITSKIKDHGKINSIDTIDLTESHCHKITIPKGTTILMLRDMIGDMQVERELEIEVES